MGEEKYAKWDPVTEDEILTFLGLCILMGINKLPALRDNWKKDPPYHYSPVASRISLDRYTDILRYLHFVDNSTLPPRTSPSYDKLCHIRPVIDLVCAACKSCFIPGVYQSIDEAMIPFKGRSCLKQYMPLKPTKRGIKVWVRSDSATGYVCEFEVYTGRQGSTVEVGLRGNVVRRLSREMVGSNCQLIMDNFFTSVPLLSSLLSDNIFACGTFRRHRKYFPADLLSAAKVGLPKRGDFLQRQTGNLVMTVWQDTKPVVVLSTNCDPTVHTEVKRKQKDGSQTTVQCPLSAQVYNKYMGGVDRADQYRGCYTVWAKSRKCYRYVFWFLFEICVFNTYVLHRYSPSASKPLTEYKDFRVLLANELIGSYCSRKSIGRPPKTTLPARALTVAHFPVKTTRGRCHYCQLIHQRQAHTVWYCQQCEHRLCHTGHSDSDCFLQYHIEKGLL